MMILVLPVAIEPLPMPAPLSPPWAFTVPPLMVILVLVLLVAPEPLPMPAPLSPPMASVMVPPAISMMPAPLPRKNVTLPMPAEAPLPVAVRLPVLLPFLSVPDVMVSLPVVPVLSSLCSRPAHWLPLVSLLSPTSVILVSPAPSTLRAASLVLLLLASMLTSFSVTLRVLSLPVALLMMRMT